MRLAGFGAAPDKRFSLGHTGTAGAPPRHNKTAQKPRRNDNWNFPPANNNTADTAQMRNFKFLPRELTMHLTKAFVAILFIISSTTTSANTLTSTTIVPAFNGGIFNLTPIKGLHQFDTSLGTITGVQFRVEFPFSVQSQIHNIEVLDIAKPHRLEAKVGFQISLADDRGRLFASHVGNPIGISCQGQGSISCSDALIGAHSDYFYQQDDITERIINSTSLQDYLGTGDVQVIRLGLFHFNQPNFRHLNFQTAQNIDISNASASISFSMAPATVVIDYFYSPVPMPPASWLTIVGLLAIGARKYIGKSTRMSIHNDISRR